MAVSVLKNALSGVFFIMVVLGPTQLFCPTVMLFAKVEFTPRKEFSPISQNPEITTWEEIKQLFLMVE